MDYRLTLAERCSIATELRTHILSLEDTRRLESINDPATKPNPEAESVYAFEFFLDRYRERLRIACVDATEYYLGWSEGSIMRDEETFSLDRVARMSTEIMMAKQAKHGIFDTLANIMTMGEYAGCGIESYRLKLFFFEIYYELLREFSYHRAVMLRKKK